MNPSQIIPTAPVNPEAVAAAEAILAQARREAAEAHKLRLQREAAEKVAQKAAFAEARQKYEALITAAIRDNQPEALATALRDAKAACRVGNGYLPQDCVRLKHCWLASMGVTNYTRLNDAFPNRQAERCGKTVAHPVDAAWREALETCSADACMLAIAVTQSYYGEIWHVRGGSIGSRRTQEGLSNHLCSLTEWEHRWCDALEKAGNAAYKKVSQ